MNHRIRQALSAGASLLLLGTSAPATIIYNADETNVNGIVNPVTGTTSQSFNLGVLTIANTGNNNFNAGIASQQDVDTLLGRPLLEAETVVVRLRVDSITGDLNANGFEFGVSSDGTTFRPGGRIFQIKPNNGPSTVFGDGGVAAGFGLNEASVQDGFSGTLTANASGYTFAFADVILASGAAATFSGTFTSSTQFRNTIGGSHFYATAQKTAADMNILISEASITVIPEPASGLLFLCGFLALARRFKR